MCQEKPETSSSLALFVQNLISNNLRQSKNYKVKTANHHHSNGNDEREAHAGNLRKRLCDGNNKD